MLMSLPPYLGAIDIEQQLIIENQELDLTILGEKLPTHQNLINNKNSAQSPSSSSPDSTDPLTGFLDKAPATVNIDAGLDALLGSAPSTPETTTSALDALLSATEKPEATTQALSGLDALLADTNANNTQPNVPSAGGLSGLDSLLGNLGAVQIEEVKIEGLGETKPSTPEPVAAKPVEDKVTAKDPVKVETAEVGPVDDATAIKESPAITQNDQSSIEPLSRKLRTESGLNLEQLVDQMVALGGWKVVKSKAFMSKSNLNISLSFQNVPLSYLIKWINTQTGLKIELKHNTLYL